LIEMGPELRIADLGAIVDTHGAEILSMKLSSESSGKRELVLSLSTPTKAEAEAIPLELSTVEGVTALDWT
jgi:hypothetical protein